MEWESMKVCAMRLDKTVKADDFMRAVDDVRRQAKQEVYINLLRYVNEGGEMPLKELVERLALGDGWPIQMKPV